MREWLYLNDEVFLETEETRKIGAGVPPGRSGKKDNTGLTNRPTRAVVNRQKEQTDVEGSGTNRLAGDAESGPERD
jgi:hypothetical protein